MSDIMDNLDVYDIDDMRYESDSSYAWAQAAHIGAFNPYPAVELIPVERCDLCLTRVECTFPVKNAGPGIHRVCGQCVWIYAN